MRHAPGYVYVYGPLLGLHCNDPSEAVEALVDGPVHVEVIQDRDDAWSWKTEAEAGVIVAHGEDGWIIVVGDGVRPESDLLNEAIRFSERLLAFPGEGAGR